MTIRKALLEHLQPGVLITYNYFPVLSQRLARRGYFYSYQSLEREFRRLRQEGIIKAEKVKQKNTMMFRILSVKDSDAV